MVLDFQYDELLIPDQTLENLFVEDVCYGYAVALRYPSYRGTFISCIESLELTVDGVPVPEQDIRFRLHDKEYLISQMKELFKEHWFVLDTAHLVVMQFGGIHAGRHQVAVRMVHRIPYTGYFGQYLVLESVGSKLLETNQSQRVGGAR